MAYKLNKTDGTLLTELVDGQIDNTSCDLTLIGRNYVGFGEALNENLIKLLENFSSTATPQTPVTGQIWYDASEGRLKVYDGTTFKSNGPIISNTQPQMVAGDIWIDNSENKLYFYDGSDLVLAGPIYSSAQGLSGFQVDTVRDKSSVDHTAVKLYVGGNLVAIISNEEYEPTVVEQTRLNIVGKIFKGININDRDNFRFYGVADSSNSLITDEIDSATGLKKRKSAAQFIPSDDNGTTTGSLFVQNQAGITIGRSGETRLFVSGNFTNIKNEIVDKGFRFRLLNSTSNEYEAIVMDAQNKRVGIGLDLGETPRADLDVSGDMLVRGNLTVEGANTTIETTVLTIDDKAIELAHVDTIMTLDQPISATISSLVVEGETVTQSGSNAVGTVKSLSSDRQTVTLEPLNGEFLTSSSASLTGSTSGVWYQSDLSTPVDITSVTQRKDTTADGTGIIVKGTASYGDSYDKWIKWINDTSQGTNWEVSDNLNLVPGKSYKIDDVTMLQENSGGTFHELGVAVEEASGLREVGEMDRLRVHSSMTLDELSGVPTITTTTGLTIDSANTITVKSGANPVKITGLVTTDPVTGNNSDAANKDYVDTEVSSAPLAMTLDVSGMPDAGFATLEENIIDTLNFLYPAVEKRLNTIARVFTYNSVGNVSGIDVQSAISYESIGVDFSDISGTDGGDANQQLVEDIGFTGNATGIVTLNVTRTKRNYKVVDLGSGNVWQSYVP